MGRESTPTTGLMKSAISREMVRTYLHLTIDRDGGFRWLGVVHRLVHHRGERDRTYHAIG